MDYIIFTVIVAVIAIIIERKRDERCFKRSMKKFNTKVNQMLLEASDELDEEIREMNN